VAASDVTRRNLVIVHFPTCYSGGCPSVGHPWGVH
jgi:hypothetical protein